MPSNRPKNAFVKVLQLALVTCAYLVIVGIFGVGIGAGVSYLMLKFVIGVPSSNLPILSICGGFFVFGLVMWAAA